MSGTPTAAERREFDRAAADWGRFGQDAFAWAVQPFAPGDRAGAIAAFLRSGRQVWAEVRIRAAGLGLRSSGERALDLGSGPGRFTQALLADFRTAVGIDVAPGMIEIARSLDQGERRCEFVRADSADLGRLVPATFDLAFSAYLFQHLPDRLVRRYVFELGRRVAPGGTLIVQDHSAVELPLLTGLPSGLVVAVRRWTRRPHRSPTAPPPWDDYWVRPRTFQRWLEAAGFEVLACDPAERPDGRMVSVWYYARRR